MDLASTQRSASGTSGMSGRGPSTTDLFRRRLRNHLANDPNRSVGSLGGPPAGPDDASSIAVAHRPSPPATAGDSFARPGLLRTARAANLAERLGGEVLVSPEGPVVRIEGSASAIPIDRVRLASLPGGPPASASLLCLDTETTGLGSAAGTVVFLVGLGWWECQTFRQAQLILPDHADEQAFLNSLATFFAPDTWLVTYNGRGFDWPLLVTRYRLARRAPPRHAGHLDLLSLVRRVFRHRLPDGRLGTVERELLGLRRHGDLAGWEIPGRYLTFVRTGDAGELVDVARHNDEDVRSLARLVGVADARLCDVGGRSGLHPGDLLGLARAYRRDGRIRDALACLDVVAPPGNQTEVGRFLSSAMPAEHRFPGRSALDVVQEAAAVERARLLRRAGQRDEALAAWEAIAAARGRMAAVAWIEIAKAREHDRRDLGGAVVATEHARAIAERSRALGRPLPLLEADIAHRRRRLARRLSVVRAA